MLSRYCFVSSVFIAFVAAAVMNSATTPSAMPRICDVCTSSVAGAMSLVSLLENDVACLEKSAGMVTTAAYVPASRPLFASSSSVSTQSKLSEPSSPLTSPPASCRPSGTNCLFSVTPSSLLTIAACTRSSRVDEFQVAHKKPPATSSGTRIRPSIETQPTRRLAWALSSVNISANSPCGVRLAAGVGEVGNRAECEIAVRMMDRVLDQRPVADGQHQGTTCGQAGVDELGQRGLVGRRAEDVGMVDEDHRRLGLRGEPHLVLHRVRSGQGRAIDHGGPAAYGG